MLTSRPGIVLSDARGASDGTYKNVNISWEVLQKLNIEAPRCMRSTNKYARHGAWECENRFLQHLCSENAKSAMASKWKLEAEVVVESGLTKTHHTLLAMMFWSNRGLVGNK